MLGVNKHWRTASQSHTKSHNIPQVCARCQKTPFTQMWQIHTNMWTARHETNSCLFQTGITRSDAWCANVFLFSSKCLCMYIRLTYLIRRHYRKSTKHVLLTRGSRKMISGWSSVYPAPNGLAWLFVSTRILGLELFGHLWSSDESIIFTSPKWLFSGRLARWTTCQSNNCYYKHPSTDSHLKTSTKCHARFH